LDTCTISSRGRLIGQWPAGRLAGVAEQNRRIRDARAPSVRAVLQTKLKLFHLTIQLLRRPANCMRLRPPVALKICSMRKSFERSSTLLFRAAPPARAPALKRIDIVGQAGRSSSCTRVCGSGVPAPTERIVASQCATANPQTRPMCAAVARQSMPSKQIAEPAPDEMSPPPPCRRPDEPPALQPFGHRHKPCHRAITASPGSPRLPRTQRGGLRAGPGLSTSCTRTAKPLNPCACRCGLPRATPAARRNRDHLGSRPRSPASRPDIHVLAHDQPAVRRQAQSRSRDGHPSGCRAACGTKAGRVAR